MLRISWLPLQALWYEPINSLRISYLVPRVHMSQVVASFGAFLTLAILDILTLASMFRPDSAYVKSTSGQPTPDTYYGEDSYA
jgi:hypothetical protein